MFLYVITNRVNGKQYVGIAVDIAQRKREHYSGHGSKLVCQAIRKYGCENLVFEIWYEGDEAWIRTMECRTIAMLETKTPKGYNLTDGGEGTIGWQPSVETRERMRIAHVGNHNGMWGRKQSAGTRRMQREKALARQHANHAMSVCINGTVYDSIKAAAKALGLSYNGLCLKIREYKRSGVWPDHFQCLPI